MIRALLLCGLAWAAAPTKDSYEAQKAWGALGSAHAGDSVTLLGFTVFFEKGAKDFFFARYPVESVHTDKTPREITLWVNAGKHAPKLSEDAKLRISGVLRASKNPDAIFELDAKSVTIIKRR